MKKLATIIMVVFFLSFLIGRGTISFGPGTPYAGHTFLNSGASYTAPSPQIGSHSATGCRVLPNNPFARFVGRFHLTCGPM